MEKSEGVEREEWGRMPSLGGLAQKEDVLNPISFEHYPALSAWSI